MKDKLLSVSLSIIVLMTLSCGGRKNSQPAHELSTFDAYDFVANYSYRPAWFTVNDMIQSSSNSLLNTYGFTFKGWKPSGQYVIGAWSKGCDYELLSVKLSNMTDDSQVILAICDASNKEWCNQVIQYAFSEEEAEKIRSKMLDEEKGFVVFNSDDGGLVYSNTFMAVQESETELSGVKATAFISTEFSVDEDYPFIHSMPLSQVGTLAKNEYKIVKDYSSQRIKFTGLVTEISEVEGKITYKFQNDYDTIWAEFENREEAYTDLSLPQYLTISGYVSDVSLSSFITLKDVRIWLNEENRYVGITPIVALINDTYSDSDYSYSNSEELHFVGYLSNGSNKYNIEMVLTITNGYEIEGYYRYTNQPADKRIPLNGYVQQDTGVFTDITQLNLYSGGGTELFSISLEDDWSKGDGDWYKYPTAEDCEMAGDNYTSHLSIWIMSDNEEDFPH